MSLYNQSVSNVPLSLDGLYSGSFNNITINGLPFDPTALVPYTGATNSINLNNKQLTNASLISTNALKILTVPIGTQTYILAVDNAGNVIRGTVSAPTQINLTSLSPGVVVPYYFSVFASNASGVQTALIDSSSTGLKYVPFTQTFYCNNLNIASVPVGTGVYTLAVDSGGAVVRSTASTTATALTVINTTNSGYIPIFDVNTGNATAYMGNSPSFTLSTLLYSFPGNITALQNITVGNVLTVNGTYISAPNLGTVPPSGVLSGYLAIDNGGAVYKATGVSAQPNITSGAPGTGYGYLTYAVAGSNQPIYVDSNNSLQYNATYSSLALGASAIPFTSLLSPSTQFFIGSGGIQSQIALAGCIQLASTVLYTYSASPQALLIVGQKVNVSGYTNNPDFNGTYLITSSTTTNFTITAAPYPPFTIGNGASASVQLIPINTGSLEFTSTSVLGPTPTAGDNSNKLATTSFVQTAVAGVSGYLTKTGTQTGINTVLQLTSGGNFTLQTSAAASLFTVIDALTTVSNDFKILKTSFPTLNISSSAIGTNRLTQFIETTAATTYTGTNTGDSIIIATNSLWKGVPSGYGQFFMNGTACVANLTRVLLSGNQSILALGSASDATSIIRSDATSDMSIIAPIIYFRSGANITMNISSTLITHNLNSTFSLGSMVAPNALPNWYTANCVSVTFGSTSTSKGIGFGYNNTSGVSQICSVQPGTAYLPLEYWGSYHCFYTSGTLMAGVNATGLFSNNAGFMTNSVGAGIAGLSAGYSVGDLIFYANSSGVMRFYNGGTCKVAIGSDRVYLDTIQLFGASSLTMPGDCTFGGTPSIRMAGGGVNWYLAGTQCGYWDNFASGWRINAISQLSLGGGGLYNNVVNAYQLSTFGPGAWYGGTLFTNDYSTSPYSEGLCVGWTSGYGAGYIISLQPSIVWKTLWLSAGTTYMGYYGGTVAYTNGGGWVNICDEREKTNIKPLKTTSSLRRVLGAKTFTYNRVYYLDEAGNDLVPQVEKDKFHVGFLAQQLEGSNPHCVSKWKKDNKDDQERLGVSYNDYTIHLIGAVQEQQKQIDILMKQVLDLTEAVNALTKKSIGK